MMLIPLLVSLPVFEECRRLLSTSSTESKLHYRILRRCPSKARGGGEIRDLSPYSMYNIYIFIICPVYSLCIATRMGHRTVNF